MGTECGRLQIFRAHKWKPSWQQSPTNPAALTWETCSQVQGPVPGSGQSHLDQKLPSFLEPHLRMVSIVLCLIGSQGANTGRHSSKALHSLTIAPGFKSLTDFTRKCVSVLISILCRETANPFPADAPCSLLKSNLETTSHPKCHCKGLEPVPDCACHRLPYVLTNA